MKGEVKDMENVKVENVKTVEMFFITHGDYEKGPYNPPLSEKGVKETEELKTQILTMLGCKFNQQMWVIISGAGRRHSQSCQIIAGDPDFKSKWVGSPEALSQDGKYVVFRNRKRAIEEYMNEIREKTFPQIQTFLKRLIIDSKNKRKNVLIIGGRIVALAAGIPLEKVKSATIYRIRLTKEKIGIEEI